MTHGPSQPVEGLKLAMTADGLAPAGRRPPYVGRICLDLIDTIDRRLADYRDDGLRSCADLVARSRRVDVLTLEQPEGLLAPSRERPAEAGAVLQKARESREALYGVLVAAIAGSDASPTDLAIVDGAVQRSLGELHPQRGAGRYGLAWRDEGQSLGDTPRPPARCAADVLTSGEVER